MCESVELTVACQHIAVLIYTVNSSCKHCTCVSAHISSVTH